ncbi:MAG: translin [Actinomycetota bacterium]|nr:translin [Actinomycetota bacterium]
MELDQVADALRERFDAMNEAREIGLSESRAAIRSCGNAIRALHRYEMDNAKKLLDEARSHLRAAQSALAPYPEVLHAGFVADAQKEYAEGTITFALVTGAAMPSIQDLEISTASYAKGMAEAIGELRRHILDLMRQGQLARCEELLGSMDDIYYVLVSMDYPDGITQGLRRLTDVARSIIERTRGDFTTSSIQSALRESLEARMERPAE